MVPFTQKAIIAEELGNDNDHDLVLGMLILRCLLDILNFVHTCLCFRKDYMIRNINSKKCTYILTY